MPTTMAALMQSPSHDSTVIANGKTLPDITLGSLGSSFRSEDENGPGNLGQGLQAGPSRGRRDMATPSPSGYHADHNLLGASPPTTVRRASSYNALPSPGTVPRQNRGQNRKDRDSMVSSSGGESDDDAEGALAARYGPGGGMSDTEDEGILASLSINISPPAGTAGTKRPTKKSGRHSVAGNGNGDTGGPMTLREQEQELDAVKKDNFNLQLENHFLKERLANMAPDHIEAALKENVKLKLEILNISKEMKKLKKLLLQQDRDLAEAARNGSGGDGKGRGGGELRELERMYKEEKERRKVLQRDIEALEASEREWKERCEKMEGAAEDHAEELEKLRDEADRALDEVDRLRAEMADTSRGSRRNGGDGEIEEYEERINELQDKLAATQLDLDKRDGEIEDLNTELDSKLKDHEKELVEVESEWRNEVLESRNQVEELKDILEQREQDIKELTERVTELQAVQEETHDRLEETLGNIQRDNAEKEADLVAANREVEELGQRVYELEELIEELRGREGDLQADLRSADEAFESSKSHYENLVSALKEARKKLQKDIEDLNNQLSEYSTKLERSRRDKDNEVNRLERLLDDKEHDYNRVLAELESAREKVALRDKDLGSLQSTLRGLEKKRSEKKDDDDDDDDVPGSEKYGLRMEIERVKRDLERCEDDLERAKEELRARDLEYSQMLDKQRELQDALSSERQSRLNISDKLDMAIKDVKKREREANLLRERIEELEPLLTETQQERFQIQKQSEQQRQERSELLLKVFKDINKFLGTEDHSTPANFAAFRDTLTLRLKSMNQVRTDFEKRVKDTEASVDGKMNSLKRQLEQKWRALDNFEAAVKKLELTRMQWRTKYSQKDGELEAMKTRNAELARELANVKIGGSTDSSTQIRSLTERASTAEKRAQLAGNQLAQLEARLAEVQSKAGLAENKWEARVREYENRLRIAGEKIKTEKQGGKERAAQLEAQVRELETQVDQARRRNQRAEDVVASAAHLRPFGSGLP